MRLGAKPGDDISAVAIVATGVSIGRDEFDSPFAGRGLADLDGWFQRRDSARLINSYRKARAWASH